jgi:hypothetical protein
MYRKDARTPQADFTLAKLLTVRAAGFGTESQGLNLKKPATALFRKDNNAVAFYLCKRYFIAKICIGKLFTCKSCLTFQNAPMAN